MINEQQFVLFFFFFPQLNKTSVCTRLSAENCGLVCKEQFPLNSDKCKPKDWLCHRTDQSHRPFPDSKTPDHNYSVAVGGVYRY